MKTKTLYKGKKPFLGRSYREQEGTFLSVTSIINPDGVPDVPPEVLSQYASRGSIVHAQVEHFLTHYRVPPVEEVADPKDIEIVEKGTLGLSVDSCNIRGFFQEHGKKFKPMFLEKKLINRTHKYGGRADIIGLYEEHVAIIDVKTSGDYPKDKLNSYWMQLAAYAHCVKPRPTHLVIIPLCDKFEDGFAEPLVETEVEHYFNLFLKQYDFVKENYILPV